MSIPTSASATVTAETAASVTPSAAATTAAAAAAAAAVSFITQPHQQPTRLQPIKLESTNLPDQLQQSNDHTAQQNQQQLPVKQELVQQYEQTLHAAPLQPLPLPQQLTPAPSIQHSPPSGVQPTGVSKQQPLPPNLTPNEDLSKKDADHIVPNAKTTTTTQANGAITTKQNMSVPTCKNCKTQTTPLWRRDETGQVLCNACGLFLKLHGRPRPISLKSDVIKSRNRIKHNNKSSPNTPELKAKDSNGYANHSQGQIQILNQNGVASPNQNLNGALNNKISSKFLPKQYKPNTKNAKGKKKDNPKENKNSKQDKSKSNIPSEHASITSPDLLPLLPRGQIQPNMPPGTPYTFATNTAWLNKTHGTNIQSLHYPSSTPTQFVSDLNRITSPLLLASSNVAKLNPTPSQSQSSERSSSNNGSLNKDALLNAAGALDLLSHQASANTSSTDIIPGMKLSSPHSTPLYKPTSLMEKLPPISLLHSNNEGNSSTQTVPAEPTHLHNVLESNNNIPRNLPHENISMTTLPPLRSLNTPSLNSIDVQSQPPQQIQIQPTQPLYAVSQCNSQSQINQLPPLKNVPGISSVMFANNEEARSMSMNNLSSHGNLQNNNDNNRNNIVLKEENEKLRTRISELELVNDLYKTRINELESLDASHKSAEALLKKQIETLETSIRGNIKQESNITQELSTAAVQKRDIEDAVQSTEKRIKLEI